MNHLVINGENSHHACLIEGESEEALRLVKKLVKKTGINPEGNPDFRVLALDTFKIENAFALRGCVAEKTFSVDGKKVFVVSANHFLPEAQNVLLRILEEPPSGTMFFLIAPDRNIFLKTLLSRVSIIRIFPKQDLREKKEAEEFLRAPLSERLEYIKNLTAKETTKEREVEKEDEGETTSFGSGRAKAQRFLNSLESSLSKTPLDNREVLKQILAAREFLRESGSSPKMILEAVALCLPEMI